MARPQYLASDLILPRHTTFYPFPHGKICLRQTVDKTCVFSGIIFKINLTPLNFCRLHYKVC